MAKITFKQLAAQKRHIKVHIPGFDEALDVSYQPGKITPKFWGTVTEMAERRELTASQSKVLQIREFVTDWGILDEEDQPLPVNEDVIASIPTPVLDAILTAINDDLYPPDKDTKKS
jgi:hypothetical protein